MTDDTQDLVRFAGLASASALLLVAKARKMKLRPFMNTAKEAKRILDRLYAVAKELDGG